MTDPVEEISCQDLAWYRKKGNTHVVISLLSVTLSFPDWNDDAPSPVDRDDQSVQPYKDGSSPTSSIAAQMPHPPGAFPIIKWITSLLASYTVDGYKAYRGVRPLNNSIIAQEQGRVVHTMKLLKVVSSSGPDVRIRKCRAISRFHCRAAGWGPKQAQCPVRDHS